MKLLPITLAFLACLSLPAAEVTPAPASPKKPNLIVILADDAGIGDFSCYACSYGKTPNIDRLASEGMQFSQAYSGSAICGPTRCVLMTGQHTGHCLRRANPSNNGLLPLPPDQMTLARLLHDAGYATGGFGKWGLGNPSTSGIPENQGFDLFFGYYDQSHAHHYYTNHLVRNSIDFPLHGASGTWEGYSHTYIANETLQQLDFQPFNNPLISHEVIDFTHRP